MTAATEDQLRKLRDYCPSFEGCCGNEQWRGHLCQYHMGWIDGFDWLESTL